MPNIGQSVASTKHQPDAQLPKSLCIIITKCMSGYEEEDE